MTARNEATPGVSDNPEAPDGRHPDDITLLKSWNNRRLTKRIWPEGKEEYDNERLFDHHYERCGSLEQIFEMLDLLKGAPTIALVRGRIVDGVGVPHRRKWASELRTMEDIPRSWLMVDVDKPVCPISDDWQDNPKPFIRKIIRKALSEKFHEAGVVVQWSSSMGVEPDTIKAHLWFRLDTPVGSKDAKRWLEPWEMYHDNSVLQVGQPHYTATPIFEDMEDPVRQRIVLIDGPDVVVPDIQEIAAAYSDVASAIGPSKYLGKSYEQHKADIGGKDFHMAMLSAVGAYVNRNWPTPDLEWLRNDLRERVMTCDAPGRKLHDREHRAGKHLDDLLDWVAETHGKRIEDQDRELARLLEQGIKEAETKHPEGGELLRNFFDDFALARGRR